MRVLHVINSTNPAGGGPIESIIQAHRVLSALGHEFEIVCVDPTDSPWLADLPIRTTALGPAATAYRYSPRLVPWLGSEAHRFDAAIVHGIWLHPSFAAWRVLRPARVPYFIYTHGLLDPAFKRVFPVRHLKKSLSWKIVEHRVVRDARAVFFTCEEERDLAVQSFTPYQAHPAIVPYCVGEPPGDSEAQKRLFLDRFPMLHAKRSMLFLSRIHPKKGCDLLITAFAEVARSDPSLHLVMAGPDSIGWRKTLEQAARDLGMEGRITWTGMLSGDLKWGAFRSAEAFVLPSHQENFGIAVVEALACGTPVLITTRVNIWREIVLDGAGTADADTPEGVERLLKAWLARTPAGRKQMSERARLCFNTRFRSEEAAANLLRVLQAHGVEG
jgi:glycosyltransferase involved in cell wall biosynthesis